MHDKKLRTNEERYMTSSGGAVVGLMGSDEQYSLPEFPVVVTYNRVNHFLPIAHLSEDSLLNWQMSQVQQLLDGAYEFHFNQGCIESQSSTRNWEKFLPLTVILNICSKTELSWEQQLLHQILYSNRENT